MTRARRALLAATLISVIACAQVSLRDQAVSAFYAAETSYIVVEHAAIAYARAPGADVEVVKTLVAIDNAAFKAFESGNTALAAGKFDDLDLAAEAIRRATTSGQAELGRVGAWTP